MATGRTRATREGFLEATGAGPPPGRRPSGAALGRAAPSAAGTRWAMALMASPQWLAEEARSERPCWSGTAGAATTRRRCPPLWRSTWSGFWPQGRWCCRRWRCWSSRWSWLSPESGCCCSPSCGWWWARSGGLSTRCGRRGRCPAWWCGCCCAGPGSRGPSLAWAPCTPCMRVPAAAASRCVARGPRSAATRRSTWTPRARTWPSGASTRHERWSRRPWHRELACPGHTRRRCLLPRSARAARWQARRYRRPTPPGAAPRPGPGRSTTVKATTTTTTTTACPL
mmetsp:Transcript_20091/g.77034  ORF Transcript_20091/g.77034 Transcript_20091/m.77034 type:complete len:284 (+) Transcript_20091:529-1380(+)